MDADRRAFIAALAGLAFALALPAGLHAQSQAQDNLSAVEARERMEEGDLVLFDVRSPEEWRQTKVAEGARTVTIHDPEGLGAFVDKIVASVDGDLERPVALICASGVRSSYAYQLLSKYGFKTVYNVPEGMLGNPNFGPGWLKRGLPLENCEQC